jgi:hypothetical protein
VATRGHIYRWDEVMKVSQKNFFFILQGIFQGKKGEKFTNVKKNYDEKKSWCFCNLWCPL